MLSQISVPTDTKPASLISSLPTVNLLERLAEIQVDTELTGLRDTAASLALCTELKTRLPEVAAGLAEFIWPYGAELSASYAETVLIFSEAALDARRSFLVAA